MLQPRRRNGVRFADNGVQSTAFESLFSGRAEGFGRQDTSANLRRQFEVGRFHVAHAAMAAPAVEGKMTGKDVARGSRVRPTSCGTASRLELGTDRAMASEISALDRLRPNFTPSALAAMAIS